MRILLSNEEVKSLAQNRLIKPVCGFSSDEDVATLLDAWYALVGSGTPWNRVVKIWEGEGYFFFELSPEGTEGGDLNIFKFIEMGIGERGVGLNPVTVRTRFGKGRGVVQNLPTTQILESTEGVYLGDLLYKADRSDNMDNGSTPADVEKTGTPVNTTHQPQVNQAPKDTHGVVTQLHNPTRLGEWVLLPQDNSVSGVQIRITTGGEVIVGRDGNSVDLILIDPKRTISRRHCIFKEHGGVLRVIDLNSSNGVRVNHHRIDGDSILNPHDLVHVGAVPFLVTKVR